MAEEHSGRETEVMKRLYIVVEGQTEEVFINEVLSPVLCQYELLVSACLIGKPGHKGGIIKYSRAKSDILMLLKQDRHAYCTTMFDYYALPLDFPGMPIRANIELLKKAEILENAMLQDIQATLEDNFRPDRFVPYIQMHEFEGLLFSEPEVFAQSIYKPNLSTRLVEIRNAFETPEHINDSTETAPSKRILRLFPEYQKPLNGVIVSKSIGISKIREQCAHFNEWVEKLISLGT